jgi:hypothetical protein
MTGFAPLPAVGAAVVIVFRARCGCLATHRAKGTDQRQHGQDSDDATAGISLREGLGESIESPGIHQRLSSSSRASSGDAGDRSAFIMIFYIYCDLKVNILPYSSTEHGDGWTATVRRQAAAPARPGTQLGLPTSAISAIACSAVNRNAYGSDCSLHRSASTDVEPAAENAD